MTFYRWPFLSKIVSGLERPEQYPERTEEGRKMLAISSMITIQSSEVSADGSRNSDEEPNNIDDIEAWDTAKRLVDKIQETTNNEVNCHEKIESTNPAPTVGNADKVSRSSIVSSCEQTRSNALSSASTTANNSEKDQKDHNNLDEGITRVGRKGSDKVVSDTKTDLR